MQEINYTQENTLYTQENTSYNNFKHQCYEKRIYRPLQ